MSRPSVYLIQKAEALQQAIRFFAGKPGNPRKERLAVFLAQIDFWDWEMENLLFSFANFQQRQQAWQTTDLPALIREQGFLVADPKLDEVGDFRRVLSQSGIYHQERVIPPAELLNQVIEEWNRLLDRVEVALLRKHRNEVERLHMALQSDLSKYRRQPLEQNPEAERPAP